MRQKLLLAVVAAILCVRPMAAHHSYAGFDTTPVTVEGRIESLKIANPHTIIQVRSDDDQLYTVVWQAINGLLRRGLTVEGPGSLQETLKVGDRITVTGRLKREDSGIAMLPAQIDHPVHGHIWPRR